MEIDEQGKKLKLWVRRKKAGLRLICSRCGQHVPAARIHEVCEREVRDLPCFELCLPQILSGAGGGRRIPAANQMFGLSSTATIEKHEKSTLRIVNKGVLSCREARIGTPVPGLELR
jgi:hypothetical protein